MSKIQIIDRSRDEHFMRQALALAAEGAGLLVHARVARVVYGASEPRAGVAVSRGQFFAQEFLNHRVRVEGGVLAEECGAMLKAFFKARR